MDLQPTLQSENLTLRPLVPEDFEVLFEVASDPLIWEQHPARDRWKRDVFQELFKESLASGGALIIIDNSNGKIIGSSRYYQFDRTKSEVVIGYTFLKRDLWGGKVNRKLKMMMLEHAFKFVDNVLFHVHEKNLRSQRAMEKIGGIKINQVNDRFIYRIGKNHE